MELFAENLRDEARNVEISEKLLARKVLIEQGAGKYNERCSDSVSLCHLPRPEGIAQLGVEGEPNSRLVQPLRVGRSTTGQNG
jgi:hypothetical protein